MLSPEARFYQRVVARDPDEAIALAEEYAAEHGQAALFDQLLIREDGAEAAAAPQVCILPARDQADELAGAMLARLLPGAQVFSAKSLAAETLEQVGEGACRVMCISAVPPHAASHASYLARRLKKQFPKLRIVVALWTSEGIERVKQRLLAAGVDEVATRLPDVLAQLR